MAERVTIADDVVGVDSPAFSPASIERNRAALYRWFGRLFFAPPGEPEVIELRDGHMRAVLESLAAMPGAREAAAAMRRALDHGNAARAAASIGAAHALLFDGAGGRRATPPYRSFFSSDTGLLCQQATAEMEQILRQYRLRLDADVHEPADHLSLQLEVMAQLALRNAEEMEKTQTAGAASGPSLVDLRTGQADFLDRQLLSWIPQLAERLAAIDELGFHAGLAALLVVALEQDRSYLVEIVEP